MVVPLYSMVLRWRTKYSLPTKIHPVVEYELWLCLRTEVRVQLNLAKQKQMRQSRKHMIQKIHIKHIVIQSVFMQKPKLVLPVMSVYI